MKEKLLEGKTAIITGGAQGIGAAIAELYASEGASVVITDLLRQQDRLNQEVEKIKESGGKAVGLIADQRDAVGVSKVFDTAISSFGDINILVVNAATSDNLRIEGTSDDVWCEVMDVNLTGPFRYAREAIRHFLPKDDGRIIFISSVIGTRPLDGAAACTSKGALNVLVRQIATQMVGTGIRVNAICPGHTLTVLSSNTTNSGESPKKGSKFDPMNVKERMNPPEDVSTRPILMSRSVRGFPTLPSDQAYGALFFASEMGRCVQGQTLIIDNGCFL